MNLQKNLLIEFFLFGTIFFSAVAQPDLQIKSTKYENGRCNISLSVYCNWIKRFDLISKDFTVEENGFPVRNLTIDCPDSTQRYCKKIGLISEISFSLGTFDTGQTRKMGLKAIIEKMQPCDEATFITFDSPIRVKQTITNDTVALKRAVDSMDYTGDKANCTGAIVKTIQEAEMGALHNDCKAIVLYLANAAFPNPQSYSWEQVIDTALVYGYHIFAVAYGAIYDFPEIQDICQQTGGYAFIVKETGPPASIKLINAMKMVYDLIDNQCGFCTLSYNSPCRDGTLRNVRVTVNKCGGQDMKTTTYTAPYDTTSFIPVAINFNTVTVTGGQRAIIDLNIGPPVDALFQTCTFRIRYDPSCCTFISFDASNGILKNTPFNIQTSPGLIEVTTQKAFQLTGSGLLASLTFQASDPEQDTECPITLESWTFNNGCLNPKLFNGKIIINARKPILDCAIELPDSLAWNRLLNNYDPNPFSTLITISNTGNREARNVKAKITLPSDNSLLLAGPTIDTQPMTPSLMKINSLSTAAWSINAKERMSSDSLQVCIDVWADNHPPIQCCKKIYIPVVGARLACALSVDKIKVDTKLNRYTPMPFTIIDTVKNTGGLPTDTVFTTIILPQGLTLANVPNNSQIKRTQPIKLLPQSKGTSSWQLYHPITIEDKKYTITICNRTLNADSVCCDVEVIIPQIDAPVLECTVTAVDSLFYDVAKDEYNPNPFPFTVAVKNNGSLDADSVRATLVLPPEFILEPPTQVVTKYFNPMLVIKYTPTLPPNEVSWMVKALEQKKRKASEIKVKLNGVMR